MYQEDEKISLSKYFRIPYYIIGIWGIIGLCLCLIFIISSIFIIKSIIPVIIVVLILSIFIILIFKWSKKHIFFLFHNVDILFKNNCMYVPTTTFDNMKYSEVILSKNIDIKIISNKNKSIIYKVTDVKSNNIINDLENIVSIIIIDPQGHQQIKMKKKYFDNIDSFKRLIITISDLCHHSK